MVAEETLKSSILVSTLLTNFNSEHFFLSPLLLAIISLVIGGGISFFIALYFFKKQQRLSRGATKKISKDIRHNVGDIKGGTVIVNQGKMVINGLQIYKNEHEIQRLFKPEKRQKEISEVEFTALRDAVRYEFIHMEWLEPEFKEALVLAFSKMGSGVKANHFGEAEPVANYAEHLSKLFKENRLNHLIIPEIRRLNALEASPKEKWDSFVGYYEQINKGLHGSLMFIGGELSETYLTKLKKGFIDERGCVFVVLESRGYYTFAAAQVATMFLADNQRWSIKRVDFSAHRHDQSSGLKGKLWIELWRTGLGSVDIQFRKQRFIEELNRDNSIYEINDSFVDTASVRYAAYQSIKQKIKDQGVAIVSAKDDCIKNGVKLAAQIWFNSQNYDYFCHVCNENSTTKFYAIFSNVSIANLYQKFTETSE